MRLLVLCTIAVSVVFPQASKQGKIAQPPKSGETSGVTAKINPKDGLPYVYIPGGSFMRGCATERDSPCEANEKPACQVKLPKGFWMGQTEVTVEAFERFIAATKRQMPQDYSDSKVANRALPVTSVTWRDAREFCVWAGLRLPSEEEWEYSARALTTGAAYGNRRAVSWNLENSDGPQPVGKKTPNRFGLYDMLGNVWEWTTSWFDSYSDKCSANWVETNLQESPFGDARVLRGGASISELSAVRASARIVHPEVSRQSDFGFRCAGDLSAP